MEGPQLAKAIFLGGMKKLEAQSGEQDIVV